MENEEIENIYLVVKKLLGSIEPQGESHSDKLRYNNLRTTIELTEQLISDIISIAGHKSRHEYSMHIAGEKADRFINRFRERLI